MYLAITATCFLVLLLPLLSQSVLLLLLPRLLRPAPARLPGQMQPTPSSQSAPITAIIESSSRLTFANAALRCRHSIFAHPLGVPARLPQRVIATVHRILQGFARAHGC